MATSHSTPLLPGTVPEWSNSARATSVFPPLPSSLLSALPGPAPGEEEAVANMPWPSLPLPSATLCGNSYSAHRRLMFKALEEIESGRMDPVLYAGVHPPPAHWLARSSNTLQPSHSLSHPGQATAVSASATSNPCLGSIPLPPIPGCSMSEACTTLGDLCDTLKPEPCCSELPSGLRPLGRLAMVMPTASSGSYDTCMLHQPTSIAAPQLNHSLCAVAAAKPVAKHSVKSSRSTGSQLDLGLAGEVSSSQGRSRSSNSADSDDDQQEDGEGEVAADTQHRAKRRKLSKQSSGIKYPSLATLQSLFTLPVELARKEVRLSKNAFQKVLAHHGYKHWPQRQLTGLANLLQNTSDDTSLMEEERQERMETIKSNIADIMAGTQSSMYESLKKWSHVYHNRQHQEKNAARGVFRHPVKKEQLLDDDLATAGPMLYRQASMDSNNAHHVSCR